MGTQGMLGRTLSKGSKHIRKPKSPTVFDEYEQRGGVLEEYEDLNSAKSDKEDEILSQMFGPHSP